MRYDIYIYIYIYIYVVRRLKVKDTNSTFTVSGLINQAPLVFNRVIIFKNKRYLFICVSACFWRQARIAYLYPRFSSVCHRAVG